MRTSDGAYGKNLGLKDAQPAQHEQEGTAAAEHATPARTFCVAGVLVHAMAQRVNDVAADISHIAGATVHASAGGKLAITLEALDPACILDALTTIQRLPGVMSAVLVSEHSEPLETIDEELKDE
jgi:nitrate reductase NapAB chaperone NapD